MPTLETHFIFTFGLKFGLQSNTACLMVQHTKCLGADFSRRVKPLLGPATSLIGVPGFESQLATNSSFLLMRVPGGSGDGLSYWGSAT